MRGLSLVVGLGVTFAVGVAACGTDDLGTMENPDTVPPGVLPGSDSAVDSSLSDRVLPDGSMLDGAVAIDAADASDASDASDAADASPPAPTCFDVFQNQDEADIDCGGALCAKRCELLSTCVTTPDCVAGSVCVMNVCAMATSTDGVRNNGETDIDCGGPNAPPCAPPKGCLDDLDCSSKNCQFNICQAPSSTDGIKNNGETDIDCGGPNAPPCSDGLMCKVGTDCIDAVCHPVKHTCSPVKCSDGIKNGKETAVDCGGTVCKACVDGKTCLVGSDCANGVCTGGTCKAPTCLDGVENQGETDIDCGGAKCGKCANGKICKVAADCTGAACTGATCTQLSCADLTKNDAETDVDCGGGTCQKCDVGKVCAAATDCASSVCSGGVCQEMPSCTGGGAGKATCGPGGNESCCTTLPVPGGTIGTGKSAWTVAPYRLDKYEITVGRMRAFLASKSFNVRAAPPAAGAGSHATIPNSGWQSVWNDRLPTSQANVLRRAGTNGGVSGCFGGTDASTWTDATSVNDPKAANCFDWYTLFAFCAADGGYLPTEREWQFAGQGGTENRTFAFGSPPGFPKATDFLPACGNPGDGPCQNPNTYLGTAYSNNGGTIGMSIQKVDPAYPTFLQAPGLYVVHAFCLLDGDRWCFSYTGANANGANAPNGSHVAPPGQKLDIGRWGHHDMSGNLIEWTLDNSVIVDPATGRQKTRPACVGTNCANLDYVDYHANNRDPLGAVIVGDRSVPGVPAFWRNFSYDAGAGKSSHDLEATYQQDGGRVMRGGSWEIAHSVNVSNRYSNYPVYRSYYASGARCARPY